MSVPVSGTEGYAEQAEELFEHYESLPALEVHRAILHLIPQTPCRVLDIGSGTGRDAAWFADMGHRVVAVEPTDAMRLGAISLHRSSRIEWLNDCLPDLTLLRNRSQVFELVMLTAVWMHLDANQRQRAMPNVASQVAIGGTLIIKLRHGPVAPGRRMFEVSPEETIELARNYDLRAVLNLHRNSTSEQNRAAGITWSDLAFRKGLPDDGAAIAVL
jgi:SAM-dependent methyltransferase